MWWTRGQSYASPEHKTMSMYNVSYKIINSQVNFELWQDLLGVESVCLAHCSLLTTHYSVFIGERMWRMWADNILGGGRGALPPPRLVVGTSFSSFSHSVSEWYISFHFTLRPQSVSQLVSHGNIKTHHLPENREQSMLSHQSDSGQATSVLWDVGFDYFP